jgi:hypothetical protein
VCCSFLPCVSIIFGSLHFPFTLSAFSSPLHSATSSKDFRKKASPVLHYPFDAVVVSRSSPRDEVVPSNGWGHTTQTWNFLPFGLMKTDARDALYDVW